MEFTFGHTCRFVHDLEKSVTFYREALGLKPIRRLHPSDMDIELMFMGDGHSAHELELGCPADQTGMTFGGSSFHIAFSVKDIEAAHKLHSEMGVIVQDNPDVEVYFIQDPDGYRIEIIPETPKEPVGWEYITE